MTETCATQPALFDDRPAATVDREGRDTYFIGFSLFRICMGSYLLLHFLMVVLPYFSEFYTDSGIYPRAMLMRDYGGSAGNMSLLSMNDYWLYHFLFISGYILALLAFIAGYRTRLATFLVTAGFVSLYSRDPLLIAGADVLTRLLLIWSLFLPLNRFFSVDAALNPAPRDAPYPSIPLIAIKMQIALIYLCSAINKLSGASWLNGNAVKLSLTDNTYGGNDIALWLLANFSPMMPLFTYGVLLFQLGFSLLVYSPWYKDYTRAFALAGAFAMHTAFLFVLNVGTFPYVCWTYLLLLVPDRWWSAAFAPHRRKLAGIRIFYEPDCGFCLKVARLLREFCLPATTPIYPASADKLALSLLRKHNSWVLFDANNRAHFKWEAVAFVLKKSPVLAPLGWLTGASFMKQDMEKLYDWIGRNRPRLGALTERLLPVRKQKPLGMAAQIMCGLMMVMMVTWNLFILPRPAFKSEWFQDTAKEISIATPEWFSHIVGFTQIHQGWNLFAPNPEHSFRHVSLKAELADGTTLDDLQTRLPYRIVDMAPNGYRLDYANHYWLKYFTRLDKAEQRRNALGRWLCRKANRPANNGLPPVKAVLMEATKQVDKDEHTENELVYSDRWDCSNK